jgi:hypothetical protein
LTPGIRGNPNPTSPNGAQEETSQILCLVRNKWLGVTVGMSQSLVSAIFHIVFSTKKRRRLMVPDLRPRLYAYIGGMLRQGRGRLLQCGGTADHIHLLASLHQKGISGIEVSCALSELEL